MRSENDTRGAEAAIALLVVLGLVGALWLLVAWFAPRA